MSSEFEQVVPYIQALLQLIPEKSVQSTANLARSAAETDVVNLQRQASQSRIKELESKIQVVEMQGTGSFWYILIVQQIFDKFKLKFLKSKSNRLN